MLRAGFVLVFLSRQTSWFSQRMTHFDFFGFALVLGEVTALLLSISKAWQAGTRNKLT